MTTQTPKFLQALRVAHLKEDEWYVDLGIKEGGRIKKLERCFETGTEVSAFIYALTRGVLSWPHLPCGTLLDWTARDPLQAIAINEEML